MLNPGIHLLHMVKPVTQVLPEEDNQSNNSDAKESDQQSFLFVHLSRFLPSAFSLMSEDNTCQGNNLLPHVNNALFVSGEACFVFTNNILMLAFVIRHENQCLYQY